MTDDKPRTIQIEVGESASGHSYAVPDRRSNLEIICHERGFAPFLDSLVWRWGMPRCYTQFDRLYEYDRLHDFLQGAILIAENGFLVSDLLDLSTLVMRMKYDYKEQMTHGS